MRVKVVKTFKARGELIPVGTVLNIRDEDLSKLIDKVYPLDQVTLWKTKTGRPLYLINFEQDRQMAPEGKAVFSLAELEKMRGLPDEQVEAIITTKEILAGSIVSEQTNE